MNSRLSGNPCNLKLFVWLWRHLILLWLLRLVLIQANNATFCLTATHDGGVGWGLERLATTPPTERTTGHSTVQLWTYFILLFACRLEQQRACSRCIHHDTERCQITPPQTTQQSGRTILGMWHFLASMEDSISQNASETLYLVNA